nr:hypothetical protein Iba_scaffold13745CG0010 [Ipomoea batatas]
MPNGIPADFLAQTQFENSPTQIHRSRNDIQEITRNQYSKSTEFTNPNRKNNENLPNPSVDGVLRLNPPCHQQHRRIAARISWNNHQSADNHQSVASYLECTNPIADGDLCLNMLIASQIAVVEPSLAGVFVLVNSRLPPITNLSHHRLYLIMLEKYGVLQLTLPPRRSQIVTEGRRSSSPGVTLASVAKAAKTFGVRSSLSKLVATSFIGEKLEKKWRPESESRTATTLLVT